MKAAAELVAECAFLLLPPPPLDPVQWAEKYRWLSDAETARPGPYRSDPFMREPAACAIDPRVREITIQKSNQTGFTEGLGLNTIGRFGHLEPSPTMYVGGSDKSLEDFSKMRLAPMLAAECFDGKISRKARDSGDTLTLKFIQSRCLVLASAASPRSLRSYPIKLLVMDELDAYPISSGGEGSPASLAIARTKTFDDRLIIKISTPTNKGASAIEKSFLDSDRRYYWVPCPHCEQMQRLYWKDPETGDYRVTWPKAGEADPETGEILEEDRPDLAFYVCRHNGCVITDDDIPDMIERGEWRAERPFRGHAGFFINELYSPAPGASFGEMAKHFVTAVRNNDIEELKTFTNLRLAETWDLGSDAADPELLMKHRQPWQQALAPEVCAITAAIDVQTGGADDRFEVALTGWGPGFERWELDHVVLRCDTTIFKNWIRLYEEVLTRTWQHPAGVELAIEALALDTSANTRNGYKFVRWLNWPNNTGRKKPDGTPAPPLRAFALKGSSSYTAAHYTKGKRLWNEKQGYRKRDWEHLYLVGTHEVKNHLFARLAQIPNMQGGPGYWHIPDYEVFGEEWFKQLTAEHRVPRVVGGQQLMVWTKKTPDARNEVLDCAVYNLIGASLADFDFGLRSRQLAARLSAAAASPETGSGHTQPVESEKKPVRVAKPRAAAPRKKIVRRRRRTQD